MSLCAVAQTLVLEKPEMPSPEKEALFFLQNNYYNYLNNYKGNIASVFKKSIGYTKDKAIKTLDSITITSIKQNLFLKEQLNVTKLIDNIGIDSIVKKENNIFELYKFDKEVNNSWQKYTLQNNQITEYLDNGAVEYVNSTYSYDKFNHLYKIIVENDYGIQQIETALTTTDAKIVGKARLKKQGKGTLVTETNYSYKNGLLVEISSSEIYYKFQLKKETLKRLHHLLTTNFYHKEAVLKYNETILTYNKKKQLIKVVENISKTYWTNLKKENTTKTFNITYKPNKLIVNMNLPEKREYVYVFDEKDNPIKIDSYIIDGNTKWLHKQVIFNIKYD